MIIKISLVVSSSFLLSFSCFKFVAWDHGSWWDCHVFFLFLFCYENNDGINEDKDGGKDDDNDDKEEKDNDDNDDNEDKDNDDNDEKEDKDTTFAILNESLCAVGR